jgi:hypothetical protein
MKPIRLEPVKLSSPAADPAATSTPATPDAQALFKAALHSGAIPPGLDIGALQQAAMQRRAAAAAPVRTVRRHSSFLHRVVFSVVCLGLAAVALAAHEHYRLTGQTTPALVSLLAAGALAFVPIRAVLHGLFAVEGTALHAVHGIGSLAFMGLGLGGVVSGAPIVRHAALAPFAIMGAAQAIMHQDHPRNARQAAALRDFATSLPEVQQFASGDLTSPANAARAVHVLTDLIGKAQVLGETELQSDPAFQSAWSRATTHAGLTLGLDAIDHAIGKLAANPATASAVPALRKELAQARQATTASR